MAKIIEKIKNTWKALTYPDGIDKEYDHMCDDAFLKQLDKVTVFSYSFFFVFSIISVYFFITRELL